MKNYYHTIYYTPTSRLLVSLPLTVTSITVIGENWKYTGAMASTDTKPYQA